MSILRFYNPDVPCFKDENANEAYEGLIHRFHAGYNGTNPVQIPASNISESGSEISLSVALPGVNKTDIRIQHEKGYLIIRVEKNDNDKESDTYTRREFNYNGTSRVFRTGEKIDTENITAKYENGILLLHLPKKEVYTDKPAQLIPVE